MWPLFASVFASAVVDRGTMTCSEMESGVRVLRNVWLLWEQTDDRRGGGRSTL